MRLINYGVLGIGLCSLLSSCVGEDSGSGRKLSLLTQPKDGACQNGDQVCLAVGENEYECGCYDPAQTVPQDHCIEKGGQTEELVPVNTTPDSAEAPVAEEGEEDVRSGACMVFPAHEEREEICTEFTTPELENCDPLLLECFLALDEETQLETIECFCNEDGTSEEAPESSSEVCILEVESLSGLR